MADIWDLNVAAVQAQARVNLDGLIARCNRIAALQRLAATADGKEALALIAEYALEGKQAYVQGASTDQTIFRAGQQQVMIDIRSLLKTNLNDMNKRIADLEQSIKQQEE